MERNNKCIPEARAKGMNDDRDDACWFVERHMTAWHSLSVHRHSQAMGSIAKRQT